MEWPISFALRRAGGIEQSGGPVGHVGDGRKRRTRRASVARQIGANTE